MFFFVRHISESPFFAQTLVLRTSDYGPIADQTPGTPRLSPILLVFLRSPLSSQKNVTVNFTHKGFSPRLYLNPKYNNTTRSINGRVPALIAIVPSPTMEDCGWEPNGRRIQIQISSREVIYLVFPPFLMLDDVMLQFICISRCRINRG